MASDLADYFRLVDIESTEECAAKFVKWAKEDAERLPLEQQIYTRYATLYNIPRDQRLLFIRGLSGHVNQLSLEQELYPVEVVPNTEQSVVRINLLNYGWNLDVWEQLADADPYFHVKVVEVINTVVETGYPTVWYSSPTGETWRYTRPGEFEIKGQGVYKEKGKNTGKTITGFQPWFAKCYQEDLDKLVYYTQSKIPIVRADWFIYQTAIQGGRKPGYYDFLGIKNRKDFEIIIGYDENVLKKSRRIELLEAVAISQVSQEPRRIAAYDVAGQMKYWRTFDSKLAQNEFNPLQILDNTFKHDAEESFGPLPNRMWVWGLFDKDGVRQDSAPDFIGFHHFTQSNNGKIEINLSCVDCHYKESVGGYAGVRDFEPWARTLFAKQFDLTSYDYLTQVVLRRQYLSDLRGAIKNDRDVHSRAVIEATGLTPQAWANVYSKSFWDYGKPIGLDRVYNEIGVNKNSGKEVLTECAKQGKQISLVVAGLRNGQKIGIKQYEEIFPVMMAVARSHAKQK